MNIFLCFCEGLLKLNIVLYVVAISLNVTTLRDVTTFQIKVLMRSVFYFDLSVFFCGGSFLEKL